MISIITITYNNFNELFNTLESIKDVDNSESIVINGGDCKQTKSYLELYEGTTISEQDSGIADAFNKGIKAAKGEYLIFINSGDILVDKNYLAQAQAFLNKQQDYDFTHANIYFLDSIAGKLNFTYKSNSLGEGMPYYHQTMLVRKSVFDDLGLFNLDYKIAMDYDFVVRMKKNNYSGHHIESFAIEMDGYGISARSEHQSISECYKSLKSHQMLSYSNFISITKRRIKLILRKIVLNTLGTSVLVKIKKIKYQSK